MQQFCISTNTTKVNDQHGAVLFRFIQVTFPAQLTAKVSRRRLPMVQTHQGAQGAQGSIDHRLFGADSRRELPPDVPCKRGFGYSQVNPRSTEGKPVMYTPSGKHQVDYALETSPEGGKHYPNY